MCRIFMPLAPFHAAEGLRNLLRCLRVLFLCPNCNIINPNNMLTSVTLSWCHSRDMGEVLEVETDTRSGFRESLCASSAVRKSLLGKYKPMFKTDIISSVEKSFIHADFICVWLHGLKYLHFYKLVPSLTSRGFPSVKFSLLEISDWIQNIISLN